MQFELTEPTKSPLQHGWRNPELTKRAVSFSEQAAASPHISTRQYAQIVHHRLRLPDSILLPTDALDAEEPSHAGSIKRDEESACCSATAWRIPVEHRVRYLGIEVDDALEISRPNGNLS